MVFRLAKVMDALKQFPDSISLVFSAMTERRESLDLNPVPAPKLFSTWAAIHSPSFSAWMTLKAAA